MFLCNVINSYMEREPIKTDLYISEVIYDNLKYCNNYHALSLGNQIIDDIAEQTTSPPIVTYNIRYSEIGDYFDFGSTLGFYFY